MTPFIYVAVLAFLAVTVAQDYDDYPPPRPRPAPARVQPGYSGPAAPRPTPVPILKQIDRHNEDGSYTYGYESADGTFKIETKNPTGEVKGKYGYLDDTGKVHVVEYGATKYGFEPSGDGITVAPPTLVDETTNKDGSFNQDYSGYYEPEPPRSAPARPAPRQRPQQSFEYAPPQQFEPAPAPKSSPVPARSQIPGSAPSPGAVQHHFDFGPPSRPSKSSFSPAPRPRPPPQSFAQPAPIEEDFEPAPAPRPAPRITYAQPAPAPPRPSPSFSAGPRAAPARPSPQFAPAPRPSNSYAPRPSASGRGGILDQLSKDYALPDSAAPLHDISFGYY